MSFNYIGVKGASRGIKMLLVIRQHREAGEAGRAVGDLSEACYYISSHIKYGFLSRDPTAK
ncbi:hypothetical protein EYF80_018580 [Liparis tanakae]|uniref:Uncharacterized protein n=1 Tax=Liparis tanakae TaxID=230148 RepID=A0A4Z2I1X6_9TELE|nr:hypothetical protein EYF80_018580 [Liparis tanakae]